MLKKATVLRTAPHFRVLESVGVDATGEVLPTDFVLETGPPLPASFPVTFRGGYVVAILIELDGQELEVVVQVSSLTLSGQALPRVISKVKAALSRAILRDVPRGTTIARKLRSLESSTEQRKSPLEPVVVTLDRVTCGPGFSVPLNEVVHVSGEETEEGDVYSIRCLRGGVHFFQCESREEAGRIVSAISSSISLAIRFLLSEHDTNLQNLIPKMRKEIVGDAVTTGFSAHSLVLWLRKNIAMSTPDCVRFGRFLQGRGTIYTPAPSVVIFEDDHHLLLQFAAGSQKPLPPPAAPLARSS